MGNFANTLFSVLLGWVQSAVAWLWKIIGADGAEGLMGWVLDNWLALVVILCILGLAVDFVVYLFRWQPYRVWRSNKKQRKPSPEPEAEAGEEALQWVYADGAVQPEAAPQPGPESMQWVYASGSTAPVNAPPPAAEPQQWVYADGSTAPAPQSAADPQQWGWAGGSVPQTANAPLQAPPTPAPVQRVIPARRRRSQDPGAAYRPNGTIEPQPGYNAPYYPPQWHAGDQQDGGTQG